MSTLSSQRLTPMPVFECGKKDLGVEEHHVVPKSLGGKRVVPLCPECHTLIHCGEKKRKTTTSKLTKEGLKKVKAQRALGGPHTVELGWRNNSNGERVPHRKEQNWITRIFALQEKLRMESGNYTKAFGAEVARQVTEEGFRTRKGKPVHVTGIYRILKRFESDDKGMWRKAGADKYGN